MSKERQGAKRASSTDWKKVPRTRHSPLSPLHSPLAMIGPPIVTTPAAAARSTSPCRLGSSPCGRLRSAGASHRPWLPRADCLSRPATPTRFTAATQPAARPYGATRRAGGSTRRPPSMRGSFCSAAPTAGCTASAQPPASWCGVLRRHRKSAGWSPSGNSSRRGRFTAACWSRTAWPTSPPAGRHTWTAASTPSPSSRRPERCSIRRIYGAAGPTSPNTPDGPSTWRAPERTCSQATAPTSTCSTPGSPRTSPARRRPGSPSWRGQGKRKGPRG